MSDAGRPAEAEGEAEDVGGRRAAAGQIEMEAELSLHRRDPRDPDHGQAEQDDDCAAHQVELVALGEEHLAKRGRRGAEGYEDRR